MRKVYIGKNVFDAAMGRLEQISELASLFAERDFSEAWVDEDPVDESSEGYI